MARINTKHMKLDLTPLKWLAKRWNRKLLPPAVAKGWLKAYQRFVRRRWLRRGNGSWKPLEDSTIARRRKGSNRPLLDTGILIGALNVGAPGNLYRQIKHGIRFGFGGASRHPGGEATIADIAKFHDAGDGVPQREIIVEPDNATYRVMVEVVRKTNLKLMRKAESKLKGSLRKSFGSLRRIG